MLVLQCIAYCKGEEGLMRFGNVYYCGGEILEVFYVASRSLTFTQSRVKETEALGTWPCNFTVEINQCKQ